MFLFKDALRCPLQFQAGRRIILRTVNTRMAIMAQVNPEPILFRKLSVGGSRHDMMPLKINLATAEKTFFLI